MDTDPKTIEYCPCRCRGGSALLVVLFVVMAVTIISFGFLMRSDMELACAANVPVKMQMDYLAESGLEHARSVLVNPQDADTNTAEPEGYWQGGSKFRIAAGDDYYDISITGSSAKLTYDIDCTAYRDNGSERVAQSRLKAKLRIDPFIAYSQGTDGSIPASMTINGDMWVGSSFQNDGTVNGDVFSAGTVTNNGTVLGDINNGETAAPVSSAGFVASSYSSTYYYDIDGDGDGDGPHTVEKLLSETYSSHSLPSTAEVSNPAGVYYRDGDLHLDGLTSDVGTLIVTGDLYLDKDCNFAITPSKNMPALIVGEDIIFEVANQYLTVNGYCQVGGCIDANSLTSITLDVNGALFIDGKGILNAGGAGTNITITADPVKSALKTWSGTSTFDLWSPAGGSFFKQVVRLEPEL